MINLSRSAAIRANTALLMLLFAAFDVPAQVYTVRDLGTQFDHPNVVVQDINDKGQVTGYTSNAANSIRRAFVIGPPYTGMTHIGAYKDYPFSFGTAINNAGVVVGHTAKVSAPNHMLVWNNGVMSTFPPEPGETGGFLHDINDHGLIAGRSGSEGMTILNGQVATLAIPAGNSFVVPQAVNNSGVVVGYSSDSSLNFKAVKWEGGVPLPVADLGGDNSQAYDIADNGLIVGRSEGPSFLHNRAFMTPPGESAINLGTFGGTSEAYSTNGTQIVGMSISVAGLRAFLYEDGVMKDLNDLIPPGSGWTLHSALSINNYGQIAGNGEFLGEFRGFLLTPINPIGGAADWIFTERDNGWTAAVNIPPFAPAEAAWMPGLGYGIRATGFPSFGFLQSPEVPLRPARTYRLWVIVANTAVAPSAAPQIRLRAFQTGNNQATILALDSVSNVLPSGGASVYIYSFSPYFSGALPTYRFYLDFTYFNPEDEQAAWVYLQRILLAEE